MTSATANMPPSASTRAAAATYEPVIGVEVHVQLATKSKMFCGCRVAFGEQANTLTCPVCQGLPGSLPVVNRRAVEFAVRIGLSLGCKIARHTKFDRKNYFYPDLPKGYQISQYDQPICYDGELELPLMDTDTGMPKRVGVIRAHMEEDSGKSIHMDHCSLVDLNRAGTPLVEIVSSPHMHSADEAYAYLTTLKRNLSYLDVSPLNMEKGSLRCDLNVSLRPEGTHGLPDYKVEVKNLNSFSNARLAIQFEIRRQTAMLLRGERPAVETRLYDAAKDETRAMRSKELANDYRYFPEPDLPPLSVDPKWVEGIRASLPEMPDQRLVRMISEYGLKEADAAQIVDDRDMAAAFEEAVKLCETAGGDGAGVSDAPKRVAGLLLGEVKRAMNARAADFAELKVGVKQIVDTVTLEAVGLLNNITAKEVFSAVMERGGGDVRATAEAMGKLIAQDSGEVEAAIGDVIAEFAKAVEEYRAGKKQTLGFLVGQVMRKLKGKANPKDLGERLAKRLGE